MLLGIVNIRSPAIYRGGSCGLLVQWTSSTPSETNPHAPTPSRSPTSSLDLTHANWFALFPFICFSVGLVIWPIISLSLFFLAFLQHLSEKAAESKLPVRSVKIRLSSASFSFVLSAYGGFSASWLQISAPASDSFWTKWVRSLWRPNVSSGISLRCGSDPSETLTFSNMCMFPAQDLVVKQVLNKTSISVLSEYKDIEYKIWHWRNFSFLQLIPVEPP